MDWLVFPEGSTASTDVNNCEKAAIFPVQLELLWLHLLGRNIKTTARKKQFNYDLKNTEWKYNYSPYKCFPFCQSKKIFTMCRVLDEFSEYVPPDKRLIFWRP